MLKANQHFILSFLAPPVIATVVCYLVYLCQFWMKLTDGVLLALLFGTFILALWLGRWAVRALVPVRCRYCMGRSYEIEGRSNRYMCRECGRNH